MDRIRQFLNTVPGQITTGLLMIAGVVLIVFQVGSAFTDEASSLSQNAVYIDAETGKSFDHVLRPGDTIPIVAPSGKKTGYPAEFCNWTKDGKPKTETVPVLLNSYVGKSGPTFCSDCGRLVGPRNEAAAAGAAPPPTKEEYASRGGNRDSQN